MTLDFLNILVNVASCIALLLSVVFLLFVRYEYNKDAQGFSQARHLMACVIFLGVITDTMAIVCLMHGSSIVVLTSFVFAATIFIQLLAGGYVGLLLFRSPLATLKNLLLMVTPAVLITAMHICGVVAFKIDNPDVSHYYEAFLDTRFAVITTWFLHITSILTLTVLGIYLIKCVRRYINVINAYYSGKDNIDAKKLVFIYHSFFFFFVSGCLNLLMRSALFNAAVVCVVSAYFVFFTIKLLNVRPLFAAIAPAYDYEQGVMRAEDIDKKEENSANEVQTPPGSVHVPSEGGGTGVLLGEPFSGAVSWREPDIGQSLFSDRCEPETSVGLSEQYAESEFQCLDKYPQDRGSKKDSCQ